MADVKFLLKRSIGTANGVLKAGSTIDLDEATAKSWEAAEFGEIITKNNPSPTTQAATAVEDTNETITAEEVAEEEAVENIEPPAAEEVKVDGPQEQKKGRRGRKNSQTAENEGK
ncbi:hypothetical protein GFC29_3875 (plasmid) [Anoxybacillus sp. B7M1]|uniref:hypothetical protein n=1 Tax=Anoxybacillus sp. B7M1 TaxID=1490057 RepID=UPI0005CD1C0F|nr:hypothetical protein [Anoxybacillus sp. B7M1]ANB66107.1 hypothetical protein GFC29_3875 [Anoxybacillus sp. B7M1]